MNVVVDACTLINLINGQVLQEVPLLSSHNIYVSDNLLDQEILNQSQKIFIEFLISENKIILLEFDLLLSDFTALKLKYDLGDGETESIALCKKHHFLIASDDFKARKCAIKELGEERIVGSLYFLRELVRQNFISCEDAKISFKAMKRKGGYLPKINDNYFCE